RFAGGAPLRWRLMICRPERSEGPHVRSRLGGRSARSFASLRMTRIAPSEWRAPSKDASAQAAGHHADLARGGDPHRGGADDAEGDAEREGDGVGAGPVVEQ